MSPTSFVTSRFFLPTLVYQFWGINQVLDDKTIEGSQDNYTISSTVAGPLLLSRSVSLPLEILAACRVPPLDLGSSFSEDKTSNNNKKKRIRNKTKYIVYENATYLLWQLHYLHFLL